jgi:ABC-type Mn2+/Zn2+ transport system ATPase subunit
MLRRLSIRNFKSTTSKDYTFNSGITLIRGPSGAGKTTIFEAIRYALFGGTIKTSLSTVGRRRRAEVSTKVMLELTLNGSNVVIVRERGKDLVTLAIDSNEYRGQEAQSIIEKYFGNEDTWISSSYHRQGEHHVMLSTPKNREELLLNILFTTDEIKPDRIRKALKRKRESIEREIEIIRRTIDNTRVYRPVKDVKFSHHSLSKDVLIYKRNLLLQGNQIISRIDIPPQQLKSFITMVKKLGHNRVRHMIDLLSNTCSTSSITNADEKLLELKTIKKVETLLSYNDQELVKRCIDLVCTDRNKVEALLNNLRQYSENEINTILNFDETKVSPKVEDVLKQGGDVGTLMNMALEYEEGKRFIQRLNITDVDGYINMLESSISHRDLCPYCHKEVLIVPSGCKHVLKPVTNSGDVSKLDLPTSVESDTLETLRRIKSLRDPGVSSSEIRDHLNATKKIKLMDIIPKSLTDVSSIMSAVGIFRFLLDNVDSEELKFISKVNDVTSLKLIDALHDWNKYMHSYPVSKTFISVLSNIDIIDSTLNSDRTVEDLSNEIREIEEEQEYKEQLKFNTKWEEIQSFKKKLSYVESMIKIVDEAEREHIDDFIQSLNLYLKFVLSKIFENCDITMDMKEINMKYNNTPDVKSLSGGEKDRVSFALLWSFHRMRKTGFLLLDECFSSIDNELKKKCLEILKDFDPNTQVLCILHDVEDRTREMFDNIIDVN